MPLYLQVLERLVPLRNLVDHALAHWLLADVPSARFAESAESTSTWLLDIHDVLIELQVVELIGLRHLVYMGARSAGARVFCGRGAVAQGAAGQAGGAPCPS